MAGGEFALNNNQGEEFVIAHNDNSGHIRVTSRDLNTVTVNTLADLRTVSVAAEYVRVTGYHTANDGAFGSHIFKLFAVKTTEVDNGGTIIIATIDTVEFVYKLQYDSDVNIKWFGAKGDGITDDSVAIQNTINFLSSGELYFPKGEYLISSTIQITGRRILLRGTNTGSRGILSSTILRWNGANNTTMFDVGTGSDALGTTFLGLGFYTNATGTLFIDGTGTFNMKIDGCRFAAGSTTQAILLKETTASGNDGAFWTIIKDSYFVNTYIQVLEDSNATRIFNCDFYAETTMTSPSLYVSDVNSCYVTNNIFEGKWDTGVYAVVANLAINFNFENNRIENYTGGSLNLIHCISQNIIKGNLLNSPYVYSGSRVTYAHNGGQTITEFGNYIPNKTNNPFVEISNLDGVFSNKNLFEFGHPSLDWYVPNVSKDWIENGSAGLRTPVWKLHTPTAGTAGAEMSKTILGQSEFTIAKQNESFVTGVFIVKALSTNVSNSKVYLNTGDATEYWDVPKDDKWHIIKVTRRLTNNDTTLKASVYLAYASSYNSADVLYIGGIGIYLGTGSFELPFINKAFSDPATSGNTFSWLRGEKVYHIAPSTGNPVGWVCTAPGAPGTWKAFGTVA